MSSVFTLRCQDCGADAPTPKLMRTAGGSVTLLAAEPVYVTREMDSVERAEVLAAAVAEWDAFLIVHEWHDLSLRST